MKVRVKVRGCSGRHLFTGGAIISLLVVSSEQAHKGYFPHEVLCRFSKN